MTVDDDDDVHDHDEDAWFKKFQSILPCVVGFQCSSCLSLSLSLSFQFSSSLSLSLSARLV